jgi:histone-lysine N-methyltransferase SETMAR
MIGSPKRMMTIFWSPLGFRVIRVLPKGVHFDAKYFRDNILSQIDRTRSTGSEEDDRRNLILDLDNAKPHTAACISEYCREKMTRAPHPPFSPDLAPSDFYLFGRLKTTMKGC